MTDHDRAVTAVARDLSAIVELHDRLLTQAVHQARARDMPGGEAMVMLATVASPEAWAHRVDAAERAATDPDSRSYGHWPDLAHEIDRTPPLQLLLFWSEQWRYDREATIDLRPTVATEAAFIRQCLDWAWEREPHWDDFARDVAQARSRLEGLLRAGTRPERTTVRCIDVNCERTPRLFKIYGERAVDDRYRCPTCERWYDESDYARALGQQLASRGAERWVALADAVSALERPERTLRRWAEEGRVRVCCDRSTHRLLVWWPDMRALHLDPPARGRPVAS